MPVFCPYCKKEILKDGKFCTECGEDIEWYPLHRQNAVNNKESLVPGHITKENRTEHKKIKRTTIFQILAVGILIIVGIQVFTTMGIFVGGMSRDVPLSNVSQTAGSKPIGIPLQPTLTITMVSTVPATQVPQSAGITLEPTLATTSVTGSLNEYCAKTYPGSSYNPTTQRCEELYQVPTTRPTPPIVQRAPVVTPTDTSDGIYRVYTWNYKGTDWRWNVGFPTAGYDYYKSKSHSRENNYAEYALSSYDRTILQQIVQKFKDGGNQKGYTQNDNVLNIVSFVQSLPYTSDRVTTGYDEYPRYPLETLIDDGGDCEDTAILTVALLHEMGYGVVLIHLPGHMAVGIKGSDNLRGTSYEFQGEKYYYLETTGKGWGIGDIPDQYKNLEAEIVPLVQVPLMNMECSSTTESADGLFIYFHQQCTIENIGVGTAKNPKMHFTAMALSKGTGMVWEPDQTISLNDLTEGATGYAEATLRIPPNELTQIKYELYGDNFEPVKQSTPLFSS